MSLRFASLSVEGGFALAYTLAAALFSLSLHDALPICVFGVRESSGTVAPRSARPIAERKSRFASTLNAAEARTGTRYLGERRSEEHTSELQSPCNIVCRLLLEKRRKIVAKCAQKCILQ